MALCRTSWGMQSNRTEDGVSLRKLAALGAALATVGGVAAVAAPPAVASCPEYWACMYTGINLTGDQGKVQQSNPEWGILSGPCSPGWNDCANSVINEFTNAGHNI